ncbi:MAG: beta-ketoacyl-[acyl-carrier-protein] synthase family protein [Pirellulales bacterium]|nr:beta-ketoacyl-[acyl-carrier-protein] synthase family protein [Pirellulales bacterium]
MIRSRAMQNAPADPVVITGIGMITSVGGDRESVWRAVRRGKSGIRSLTGIPYIPDGLLIGAPVDLAPDRPRRMKVIALSRISAAEALHDSGLDLSAIDRSRVGCAISGHMGDTGEIESRFDAAHDQHHLPRAIPWWEQFFPCTACDVVANEHGLLGPRICHSTACASGLIDILSAVRSIEDGQCDVALAGSAEAIHPLFAAGFLRMNVLAHHDDPAQACRPFDRERRGFVMGEGAAMFVLERLSHAVARRTRIYATFAAGTMAGEAHHVTGLDEESHVLAHAIQTTLRKAQLDGHDIGYINVHGTGTLQNDVAETRGIRRALGRAADQTCVSATKSMLGHLVNAAGSVELAITTLALRDGFAPPTMNLINQDPECDLDCIPLVGRRGQYQHALKLSVAFGGHIVAVALNRWNAADSAAKFRPAAAA